jgi:pyrroloquinoline quinone (PQQ) biosynthesis protein C
MALSGEAFVREIQRMVERKHSKDHPIIAAIEAGDLSKKQLKGFVGQFYLYFPKPFPKPIAAMLGRCPEDPELERMWIDNVMEEARERGPKPAGTRIFTSDLRCPAAIAKRSWMGSRRYPKPRPFWPGVSY